MERHSSSERVLYIVVTVVALAVILATMPTQRSSVATASGGTADQVVKQRTAKYFRCHIAVPAIKNLACQLNGLLSVIASRIGDFFDGGKN